jgi:hypothetical protein
VERRVKHPPLQEGQGWGTRKGEGRCLGEGVARDSEGIREKACYRGGKDYYDARNKCPEDLNRATPPEAGILGGGGELLAVGFFVLCGICYRATW